MINRRDFASALAAPLVTTSALLSAGAAQAQAAAPKEGKDYLTLAKPAPTDAAQGQLEVVEFFWYSCPHCNTFEPRLEAWVKNLPKDVSFRRAPVAFRSDFEPQQRLYFVLEALGLLDSLHAKVFNAIHVQRLKLANKEDIAEWLSKQNVDTAKFSQTYDSFSVVSKARRASQLQDAYQVEGVPSLGIAGRFYTDGQLTGSMERVLQTSDYLLAELRKGR
jgi:thiol:disulfide interchange protein DsbA